MDEKKEIQKNLDQAETKKAIEEVIEGAETYGYEDIVESAKQKLEALTKKVEAVETTPPAQVAQVEGMGGSAGEIETRTAGVDEKIEAVKVETTEKISEVQAEASPVVERPPIPSFPEKPAEVANEKSQEEIAVEQLKIANEKFLDKIKTFIATNDKYPKGEKGATLLKQNVEKKFLDGGYDIHQMRLLIENGLITQEEVFTGIQNTRDRFIKQDTYDKTSNVEEVSKRTDADMGIVFWKQSKTPQDIQYLARDPKIDNAIRLGVARIMDPQVGGFTPGEREKLQKMISESGY